MWRDDVRRTMEDGRYLLVVNSALFRNLVRETKRLAELDPQNPEVHRALQEVHEIEYRVLHFLHLVEELRVH